MKKKIIKRLKTLGYDVEQHKVSYPSDLKFREYYIPPYLQTNNVIIYDEHSNPVDTISNIKYSLEQINENKTRIEIINVTLDNDLDLQKWQVLKQLQKKYEFIVQDQFVKELEIE